MAEIIHDIAAPAILSILSVATGYIVWLLQQQRTEQREAAKEQRAASKLAEEELQAIKKGLMLKLRRDILDDHKRYYTNREPLTPEDFDTIVDIHDAYKALGGNGTTDKAFDEIKTIPLS